VTRDRGAYRDVDRLLRDYEAKEAAIDARLAEFRDVGRRADRDLFAEMAFCILAIQTKGRVADAAVRALAEEDLLWTGPREDIASSLRHRVRFHNHKAAYLVAARDRFLAPGTPGLRSVLSSFGDPPAARAWLVREVDGFGLKEASHFLRNVGHGEDLAILDRHILRNVVRHRIVGRMPRSLTPRRYLAIEDRMRAFASDVGIPLGALDLLFWSRETGEIFK
jgi:N-glycosylase/DNA lyase